MTSKLEKGKVVRAWIPKSFLNKDSTFAGIGKYKKSVGPHESGALIQVEIKPITTKPRVRQGRTNET